LAPRRAGRVAQLRRFLGEQKATLLWDGLPTHRRRAMGPGYAASGPGWWWEPLPGHTPDLNPVEALWSTLKAWS
jgi:transposase